MTKYINFNALVNSNKILLGILMLILVQFNTHRLSE